jgi:hypothetical protein
VETSPIDRLAAEIAEALRLSGLIREKDVAELQSRLAGGRMTEQNWKSIVSHAIPEETDREDR